MELVFAVTLRKAFTWKRKVLMVGISPCCRACAVFVRASTLPPLPLASAGDAGSSTTAKVQSLP